MRTEIRVESALAIYTVESAALAITRLKVNTKRDAKATAMDRSENWRRIDYCAHYSDFYGYLRFRRVLSRTKSKVHVSPKRLAHVFEI